MIAYEQSGTGPVVILVASSLADRSDTKRLAALLAAQFTVINYDRRGGGLSGDTPPYQVEREIDDIAALINSAGGSAFVFGSSSGAVLALRAAASGLNITKLALYEPPFRHQLRPRHLSSTAESAQLPRAIQAFVAVLENARRRTLAGQGHSAPVMAPKKLAPILAEFLEPEERAGDETSSPPGREESAT